MVDAHEVVLVNADVLELVLFSLVYRRMCRVDLAGFWLPGI